MPKIVDTIDLASSDVIGQLKRTGVYKLLESLPLKVEGNIMRRALRAGAVVMRDEARRLAPVLTGALKKSIQAVSSSPRAGEAIIAKVTVAKGTFVRGENGKARKVTAKKYRREGEQQIIPRQYAHLVESGHGGPQPAKPHPFMRPAADTKKGEAISEVARVIKEGVLQEVGHL